MDGLSGRKGMKETLMINTVFEKRVHLFVNCKISKLIFNFNARNVNRLSHT